jgi:hypothetical protein
LCLELFRNYARRFASVAAELPFLFRGMPTRRTLPGMALGCFRCAGAPDLEHARDCPHRTAPVPPVVELQWPTGDDGKPVSLERAIELLAALNAATSREPSEP